MPRQQQLLKREGENAKVESAAKDLHHWRSQRLAAQKQEIEAEKKLRDVLKTEKLKEYTYEVDVDGQPEPDVFDVTLERPEARAYVRKHKEEKETEEEEESAEAGQ